MTKVGERKTARKSQGAIRRLLALSFALVAVVLVSVALLLFGGAQRLDELKVREDRFLIANAVDRIQTRLVSDMTTATVWDQAYANMRPGGDLVWADNNIGTFFANNRGFDRTIAIDGQDRLFYGWVGKHRVDAASQAQFLADAMPLVRRLRAIEAARGANRPKVEPTDPSLAETAKGIFVSGGVRYLIGASTVTPSEAETPRRPGPAVMVISAQALDRPRPLFAAADAGEGAGHRAHDALGGGGAADRHQRPLGRRLDVAAQGFRGAPRGGAGLDRGPGAVRRRPGGAGLADVAGGRRARGL